MSVSGRKSSCFSSKTGKKALKEYLKSHPIKELDFTNLHNMATQRNFLGQDGRALNGLD